jgi:hypothetical protein
LADQFFGLFLLIRVRELCTKILLCINYLIYTVPFLVALKASQMKSEEPKRIDIHEDELRGILQIVESHLTPAQYKILAAAVNMLIWLQFSVKGKSLSIARLGRMLFGKKTENVKNLKARTKNQTNSPADEAPTTESSVDAGIQEAAVATESGDLCSEGSAVAEESIDSPACGDEGSKSSPEEKTKEADQQAGPADNKKDASLSEPTSNGTGSSAPPSPEKKRPRATLIR